MSNSHPMSVIRKTGRSQAATGCAEGRIHVPLKDHATPTRASDTTTGNARLSTPKVHLVAGKNFEAENSKAPVLANPVRFQPLRSTCEASRQATGSGVNVKMHVNKPTHSIGPGPRIYVYNTIPPQVYTQAPVSKQDQRVPQASSTNRDINRSHLPAAPFDEDAARHDKALVSNGHGSLITGTTDVFFPQHTQESELEELCDDGKEAVQEQRRQDNLKHLIIKTEKDWAVLTIDTSQLKQADG